MVLRAEIGARLRKMRTERRLTQKELASRINGGIDYTYIGKIERGEQLPSLKILLKIAEALSVPPQSFFQDEASLVMASPRLQGLLKAPRGLELLTLLQDLSECDLPLVVEIVRVLIRHHTAAADSVSLPLAAEENPQYGKT